MKKTSIGAWILTYNPAATDVISKSGFDWVCIDLEHSSLNFTELSVLLNVLEKNKTESFVRVSSNDKTQIKKALDLGAKGIIVPMVNDAKEAKKAVDCSYYPPFGSRGLGFARAQGFGFDLKNYLKKSKNIKLIVQIESLEAINNLEKILKVKGLSGTFIGPYDLSGSLGQSGNFTNKKYINSILKYEKLSKKYKVPMGIHVAYPDVVLVNKTIRKGYKFIAMGTDMTFLGTACREKLIKIKKK